MAVVHSRVVASQGLSLAFLPAFMLQNRLKMKMMNQWAKKRMNLRWTKKILMRMILQLRKPITLIASLEMMMKTMN